MSEGWRCPVCGKGNAPWAWKCYHCQDAPQPTYGDNTTNGWLCGACGQWVPNWQYHFCARAGLTPPAGGREP